MKPVSTTRILLLALALSSVAPAVLSPALPVGLARAQSVPPDPDVPPEPTPDPTPTPTPDPEPITPPSFGPGGETGGETGEIRQRERSFINERGTAQIVAALEDVRVTCDRVNQNYRIPCLREELRRIARTIPRTGEYAPVRQALLRASDDLADVANRYADRTQPRVRARIGGKPAAPYTAPITAIRPEAVDQANAEAAAILDEAVTTLLRSAENSERRQVAYQPIARALDSTKVLLRSA